MVGKEQQNGILLIFNDAGYVCTTSFRRALKWHCPYCSEPSLADALRLVQKVAPATYTVREEGGVFVDPQVIIAMCSYLEKSFAEAVLTLMLRNHRARNPPDQPPQPTADEFRLKLAQEKTKQIQLKADTTQRGLSTIESYSVSSRPNVVELIKDIFSGFGEVSVSMD